MSWTRYHTRPTTCVNHQSKLNFLNEKSFFYQVLLNLQCTKMKLFSKAIQSRASSLQSLSAKHLSSFQRTIFCYMKLPNPQLPILSILSHLLKLEETIYNARRILHLLIETMIVDEKRFSFVTEVILSSVSSDNEPFSMHPHWSTVHTDCSVDKRLCFWHCFLVDVFSSHFPYTI